MRRKHCVNVYDRDLVGHIWRFNAHTIPKIHSDNNPCDQTFSVFCVLSLLFMCPCVVHMFCLLLVSTVSRLCACVRMLCEIVVMHPPVPPKQNRTHNTIATCASHSSNLIALFTRQHFCVDSFSVDSHSVLISIQSLRVSAISIDA